MTAELQAIKQMCRIKGFSEIVTNHFTSRDCGYDLIFVEAADHTPAHLILEKDGVEYRLNMGMALESLNRSFDAFFQELDLIKEIPHR
jgi:hypothetical protein